MHLYKMIISKMYSPLAEDHATLGWSADGGVPLQHWDHIWYSTSLSVICTPWGKKKKNKAFCPRLPSCCAPLVPTGMSQKTKATPDGRSIERGQTYKVSNSKQPKTYDCITFICHVISDKIAPEIRCETRLDFLGHHATVRHSEHIGLCKSL